MPKEKDQERKKERKKTEPTSGKIPSDVRISWANRSRSAGGLNSAEGRREIRKYEIGMGDDFYENPATDD